MTTLFFRHPTAGFHSVEEAFAPVLEHLGEQLRFRRLEMPHAGASPRSCAANILFARQNRSAVNHITGHIHYAVLGTGRNTVLTVLDTGSTFTGSQPRDAIMRLLWFWLPARMAKRITTISDFSRLEFLKLVPFAKQKTSVVYVPVSPRFQHRPKEFAATCPRILHLGTKTNKNLERTLQALREIPCTLVIVGRLNERQKTLLGELGIQYENRVDIPFSDIIREYERCDLVSFASTYEGFGMPIVEAQAVGRPVLAGNVASMPEVAGDAAVFVDPFSTDSIRQGMMQIMQNADLRDRLVTRGLKNVKRFRAAQIAQDYIGVYRQIAGKTPTKAEKGKISGPVKGQGGG